jgi:hypothetical protein
VNGLHVVVLTLALVILAAAWLGASLAILHSDRLTTVGRAIWLAAVFVFPVLGPVAWLASRRRPR